MSSTGRWAACAVLLLLTLPSLAKARDRDHREIEKQAAYQAGVDDGYREGMRQGLHEYRFRLRYHDRPRYYDRAFGYNDFRFAYKDRYKKGYRDGYRRGYRDGYERRETLRR